MGDTTAAPAPAAWEVFDPKMFFGWSTVDKRAILRASGVTKLPRPREGVQLLDDMLLDLMDDAVRSEIRRLNMLSKSNGRRQLNARIIEESDEDIDALTRQELLEKIGEKIDAGNVDAAIELRERFIALSSLKADPTQAPGSYDRYLDQDDWYMANRKKSMGGPAGPNKR